MQASMFQGQQKATGQYHDWVEKEQSLGLSEVSIG